MNIKAIIRDTISEYISIDEDDIEGAVRAALENIDIAEKVQDAIEELLPMGIEEAVEAALDDAIVDAVEDAIEDIKRDVR